MRSLIDLNLTSQWNGGYVMEFSITNTGSEPILDYRIGFETGGTLSNVWGGTLFAADNGYYEIGDDDADNDIAPGETVRFKIKVTGDGTELPSDFTVNGESATLTPEAEALVTPVDPLAELPAAYAFVDGIASIDADITAEQLQTLIDNAPQGATIQLAAGDYAFDDALTIGRSDLSLVGAGSDETRITFTDAALANEACHAILVQGGGATAAGTLRDDIAEGANRITLNDGHGLGVGDTIRLSQTNDDAFLDTIGDTLWRESDSPLRTSMAKVVAVDGDTITLDRGVHFDFVGGDTQVERLDALENVSLSGFSVNFELGEPDAGNFSNTLSTLDRYHAIEFNTTVGGEISDVTVTNGPSTAFEFAQSLDIVASALTTSGAFNKGGGGNGYGFELRESYDGQYDDLTSLGMRHGMLFASWSSSVGNNIDVTLTDRDINFHGGRDHDNTIHVAQSIRDADHDAMSTTVWVNGGESFGAPTDGDANTVTFDYVVGSRRDDVIHGTDDGVYLDGGLGNDTLYGGAGNDILRGGDGWGDDVLDGGDGYDIALLDRTFAEYTIRYNDDGSLFLDGIGDDDTLIDVEWAVFADGVALDVATGIAIQGETFITPAVESILAAVVPGISVPLEPAPATPEVSVAFESVSRWSSGYVMAVELTNNGTTSIDNPQIGFQLGTQIDQLYGAKLLGQDDNYYLLGDSVGASLDPGATMRFSFKAYADESLLPQSLTLNGQALDVDTDALQAGSAPGVDALTTVTSDITSQWSSGYVAEVLVTNNSDETLHDVSLDFTLAGEIDTLWNATASGSDGHYTVSDDSAATLAPGETWRFSYKSYSQPSLPEQTTVNGTVDEPDDSGITLETAPVDLTLSADDNGDLLVGYGGNDTLTGGAGDDRLIGGEGNDTLAGDEGADSFVFRSTFESAPSSPDIIVDFSRDEGDVIDLSGIDANLTRDGDQAFIWRGAESFTGNAGELRLAGNELHADVNGDGVTDMAIELAGVSTLDAQGLIL